MTLYASKPTAPVATDNVIELLADLLKINNDRIAGYGKALDNTYIDKSLRNNFELIISEGIAHRDQLVERITQLHGNTNKSGTTLFGKIYRAWMDLRVAFSYSSQKTILASCLYNEQVALHAYAAALDINMDIYPEIIQIIEAQQKAISNAHEQIRKYREACHIANYSLSYFN